MSSGSDVDIEELSVADVCPTVSNPFPVSLPIPLLLRTALSQARIKPSQKSRLAAALSTSCLQQGFECLYWFTFCRMFYTHETARVQEELKEQLSACYVKLLVLGLDDARKDHLQFIPLVFSHCICEDFYSRFSVSRAEIDESFVLSATHMVYETLLGVSTTDVFLRSQLTALYDTRALRFEEVNEYIPHRIKEEVEERRVPRDRLQRMQAVPGGQQFAEDLYKRSARTKEKKPQVAKMPMHSDRRGMSPAEIKLERVVRHYSTPHIRREESARRSRVFNCVKLSPMLSNHLQNGVVLL